MSRPLAVLLLLICTMLWGFAFLAQKSAMQFMGPLTFAGVRYLLGGLAVLPAAIWEYRRKARTAPVVFAPRRIGMLALLSIVFLVASWLQQEGLRTATITNGGFLTSLYVFFVPLIAFAALRARPHPIVYLGAPLALLGIFLLNGARLDQLVTGDFLLIAGAAFWAMHVLLLSATARETGLPIAVSAATFLIAGALALLLATGLESPRLEAIGQGWMEILYAGLLSTAVAFTLQALGQQYVQPANAAIILSAESLFAALGGAIWHGERLPPIGYAGAALIFFSILMVEIFPAWRARPIAPPPPGSA